MIPKRSQLYLDLKQFLWFILSSHFHLMYFQGFFSSDTQQLMSSMRELNQNTLQKCKQCEVMGVTVFTVKQPPLLMKIYLLNLILIFIDWLVI